VPKFLNLIYLAFYIRILVKKPDFFIIDDILSF